MVAIAQKASNKHIHRYRPPGNNPSTLSENVEPLQGPGGQQQQQQQQQQQTFTSATISSAEGGGLGQNVLDQSETATSPSQIHHGTATTPSASFDSGTLQASGGSYFSSDVMPGDTAQQQQQQQAAASGFHPVSMSSTPAPVYPSHTWRK